MTIDDGERKTQPSEVRTFEEPPPTNEAMIERALQRLRQHVRHKGLKNSQVREMIVRAALTEPGHFSVEDLMRAVRDLGVKNAHTATIYRSMPLLVEAGIVEPALISQGDSQLYECVFERDHHDHLICTKCGRVVEFYSETLEAIQREIAERYGYRLDDHVHELRGLCQVCWRDAESEATPSS